MSEDTTLNPEEYAWIQRITCIKQEPPDDESEAGSPDSGFTTSSETPPSPSVFQTIESGNSGFQCPQCKKYYKTASSLRVHVCQQHSGERTCNQCQPPVTLKSAKALANHNHSYHSGERTCNQCQPPVTLNSAKALANHNYSHHSGERTCNQCQPPVTLNSTKALITHNYSHHSGEHTCNQCQPPVTLNSAQALSTHNRRHHSGERTCNQCQPRSPSIVLKRCPITNSGNIVNAKNGQRRTTERQPKGAISFTGGIRYHRTISQHEATMSSRPQSKLKQLLVRDQLWWRYYLRNVDTICQAVIDTICKVLACGRVIMGYASFACSNDQCIHIKTICFGCKARLCNTCGKKLTDQWIVEQKALLPDTEWQHITFTMPGKRVAVGFWLIPGK